MGYSEDSSMVRVDFFKSRGKWYTTEAVKWTGPYCGNESSPENAFAKSLRDHLGERLSEMDAVCLHPYHEHSYPLMLRAGSWHRP